MDEQDYITIEKYLNGELVDDELKAFENRLQTDKEFANQMELYKEVEHTISSRIVNREEKNRLSNTLKSLGKEYIPGPASHKKKVISLFSYKPWAVAASVAIIIWVSVLYNSHPRYNDYAIHPVLELTVRGTSNDAITLAEHDFNSSDYTAALQDIDKLLLQQPENIELLFFKGIALLELDRYAESEAVMETIKNGTSVFKYKAVWYLALNKLKQKQYDECKAILKEIPENAEDYAAAQKLLKKL